MAAIRMPLFKPVYMDQRVALCPSEFKDAAEDIDTFLLKKMKKNLEGVCCTHGYVKPGSAQILARSMGQAEHGRFTGDFMFHCKLKLQCLLPTADQLVDARILKVNKLGAYALVVEDGRVREAMRILIPRDLHIGNAEFDSVSVGKGIRVKLLRSRFQSKDAFIQSVGLFDGFAPGADAKAEPEAEAETEAKPDVKPDAEPKPDTEAVPKQVIEEIVSEVAEAAAEVLVP